MIYTESICAFIGKKRPDEVFSVRDLLSFSTRGAADMCLSRMVQRGQLKRVARGLYCQVAAEAKTTLDLAKAKADSFGRELVTHAHSLAQQLNLLPQINSMPIFSTVGGSSTFKIRDSTVQLTATCARKMTLERSPAGRTVRALWSLQKEAFYEIDDDYLLNKLPQDILEIVTLARWMPSWMSDRFVRLTILLRL